MALIYPSLSPIQMITRNTDVEKKYFSLNVQAVCSPYLQFINIVSRWKGATHDSKIWLNSSLCARFENNEISGFLLGDNGYACSRYLMTPVLHARTDAERRYNRAHIRARNWVERLFGVWKNRFLCLRRGLRFGPNWTYWVRRWKKAMKVTALRQATGVTVRASV